MIRRLLAAWALLFVLAGFDHVPGDPYRLAPIASAFNFDGVSVTTRWTDCGEPNAYYDPSRKEIILCNELVGTVPPALIRFYYAHEYSHAVIYQRDLPIVGSPEVAADELATVILDVMGLEDVVYAAATHYVQKGDPEYPYDPHPGDIKRGLTIGCLSESRHERVPALCYRLTMFRDWPTTVKAWNRLLGIQ